MDGFSFARRITTTEPPADLKFQSGDLTQIECVSGAESLPRGPMLSHEAILWQCRKPRARGFVPLGRGRGDLGDSRPRLLFTVFFRATMA